MRAQLLPRFRHKAMPQGQFPTKGQAEYKKVVDAKLATILEKDVSRSGSSSLPGISHQSTPSPASGRQTPALPGRGE